MYFLAIIVHLFSDVKEIPCNGPVNNGLNIDNDVDGLRKIVVKGYEGHDKIRGPSNHQPPEHAWSRIPVH